MNLETYYMFAVPLLVLGLVWLYFIISTSIGFNTLFLIHRAKKGQKKGLILINLYKDDGTSEFKLAEKKGGELILTKVNPKDKDSAFILKSECIYRRFGLNMLDYFEKDLDPRDWRTGEIATTSPIAQGNIITNAIKAELLNDNFMEFIKRNLLYILLAICAIIAVLAFVIITQNDQLITITGQYISDRVIQTE